MLMNYAQQFDRLSTPEQEELARLWWSPSVLKWMIKNAISGWGKWWSPSTVPCYITLALGMFYDLDLNFNLSTSQVQPVRNCLRLWVDPLHLRVAARAWRSSSPLQYQSHHQGDGDPDDKQWCIFRLTCSHRDLTKDHVLASAYVKIFRTVTRNAVNENVWRKKDCSWLLLNKRTMNIWLSSQSAPK